jgi:hypothetical protein
MQDTSSIVNGAPPLGEDGLLRKRKRRGLNVAQLMLQPALPLPDELMEMWKQMHQPGASSPSKATRWVAQRHGLPYGCEFPFLSPL